MKHKEDEMTRFKAMTTSVKHGRLDIVIKGYICAPQ